jgi:hypothetical protein
MQEYPLIYLDKTKNEIRLKRDKKRNYETQSGVVYNKNYVWDNFQFVKHERYKIEFITTPNGFRVRKES